MKSSKDDEKSWETIIHPLFIQTVANAAPFLLENGYMVFSTKRGHETFKNNSGIYISIINQGYDFPEVYIGENDSIKEMIRLDFMLELFLTNKTEVLEKHKSLNHFYDFEYEKEIIELYHDSICKIKPFPAQYNEWIKSNIELINSYKP